MKKRILFELRTGSGPGSAWNIREARVETNGDLVVSGYDSDPDLESFTGSTEWEGEVRVAARDIPAVRARLTAEFGAASSSDPAESLFDLLEKGFGGQLTCYTRFAEWLEVRGLAHDAG